MAEHSAAEHSAAEDSTRRRHREMADLLQDHKARVALLEPFVKAHSLMPRDVIQRAEQQNARRASALVQLCQRYSKEVQLTVDRHAREQAEERRAEVHTNIDPQAGRHTNIDPPAPAPAAEIEE